MEALTNWLILNREWLFSGIGIVILSVVAKIAWGLFCNKEKKVNQAQSSGDNSINVQSAKDININSRKDH